MCMLEQIILCALTNEASPDELFAVTENLVEIWLWRWNYASLVMTWPLPLSCRRPT